ncbi:MAG TPA: amidohydrolase family protein [Candidatus Limnocylindria bacterium]|jgi:N-acyl-D-amino-acid deacylase|nr:amidohydrolase family protein [Candidatus Limnocylindria bacterium]
MHAGHDVVIRGGTVYDGSGAAPSSADVAIDGDRITSVGTVGARGHVEIDAGGLAVAPGFINMLSWATTSLIADGRSQSDIRQGVTLEVFGEGWSLGPVNDAMRREQTEQQGDITYDITWTTLAEALDTIAGRGISPNIASFVGAASVRIHELAHEDRRPSPTELERMRGLVDAAMRDGALGLGSALIYAPATYANTDELVALADVAGRRGGMYISHLRSEGNRLLEAVDEVVEIARRAKLPAEIYHLKQAGRANWTKLDEVIDRVKRARADGLAITADMYPYEAGATGLSACFPPWAHEGGLRATLARLRDPSQRARIRDEMARPGTDWENLYEAAGTPEGIVLVSFKNERLKPLTGRTLGQVAAQRAVDPRDAAMDLVLEDESRVGMVIFMAAADNLRREVALPWMSFGSDAGSIAPEGVFLLSQPHPRTYGTFARVLGTFVRDEHAAPLEDVIHRMTGFPAANLKLDRRGQLRPGFFADVVAFDRAAVQDHATYTEPHRYATGVAHVLVNGIQVLRDGDHTGARPGRVVFGPARRDD